MDVVFFWLLMNEFEQAVEEGMLQVSVLELFAGVSRCLSRGLLGPGHASFTDPVRDSPLATRAVGLVHDSTTTALSTQRLKETLAFHSVR